MLKQRYYINVIPFFIGSELKKDDLTGQQALFYKAIIKDLPTHVYWKDCSGVILGCNIAQAKFLGFSSPAALIGKTDYDLMSQSAADKVRDLDVQVLCADGAITREEEFRDHSGRVFTFLSKKQAVVDAAGNVIGLMGTSIDITAEKERILLTKQKEASKEKIRSLQLFAASIAHEMRSPLSSVSAVAHDLKRTAAKFQQTASENISTSASKGVLKKQDFDILNDVSSRLEDIVSDAGNFIDMLLECVRGRKALSMERVSALAALRAVIGAYPVSQKSMVIINLMDEHDFTFYVETEVFKHVIFNLLKNAIYHIRKAEKGHISVWLEPSESYNIIHFKDTGPGISNEVLSSIFEPFFSQTPHGTGIGLSYCKMMMSQMGGKILCDSLEGQYTHFQLYFPVKF